MEAKHVNEIREVASVINPEIPETPEDKLALLRLCIDALANGRPVEGISPRHVSLEGMHLLKRHSGNAGTRSGL